MNWRTFVLPVLLALIGCAYQEGEVADEAELEEAEAGVAGGGVFSLLQCKLVHRKSDDPIVFPNQPGAAHLHDFFGSKTTFAFSTYQDMISSDTSCPLTNDTAGYWVPTLLDKNGKPVPLLGLNAYYRSPVGVAVQPFPKDLRIIAGGDTMNPPEPTAAQRSLSWSCVDSGPFYTSPPDCSSLDKNVIAHIAFPNCLKSGKIDSADHRSHMTYGGKNCPTGYLRVPKLSFHVRYAVKNAKGFRLSSDMSGQAGGRSLHGDFWNTWDQPALAFLVDHCLNGGRNCKVMTDAKYDQLGGP